MPVLHRMLRQIEQEQNAMRNRPTHQARERNAEQERLIQIPDDVPSARPKEHAQRTEDEAVQAQNEQLGTQGLGREQDGLGGLLGGQVLV